MSKLKIFAVIGIIFVVGIMALLFFTGQEIYITYWIFGIIFVILAVAYLILER
jgi:hypothetical protein